MTTSIAPSTPEAVEDSGGLSGEFRGYIARLRGGDTGSVPAVLGLIVLVALFTILQPQELRDQGQLRQPADPERAHHLHRDGPGLRPAAGRDRPVGRLHGRHGRRGPGRPDGPARRAVVAGHPRGTPHRRGHRPAHRPARRAPRHPVVRRHPGVVPRAAGRAAPRHRRGRHDPGRQSRHLRAHEQQPDAVAGLAAVPARDRGLCGASRCSVPASAGRPGCPSCRPR